MEIREINELRGHTLVRGWKGVEEVDLETVGNVRRGDGCTCGRNGTNPRLTGDTPVWECGTRP